MRHPPAIVHRDGSYCSVHVCQASSPHREFRDTQPNCSECPRGIGGSLSANSDPCTIIGGVTNCVDGSQQGRSEGVLQRRQRTLAPIGSMKVLS